MVALCFIAIGQYLSSGIYRPHSASALSLVGLGLLVYCLLRWKSAGADDYPPPVSRPTSTYTAKSAHPRIRRLFLLAAFVASIACQRILAERPLETPHWDIAGIWALSIALYAMAWIRIPSLDLPIIWKRHGRELSLVILLTSTAFFLRFLYLGSVPAIISGDEGMLGVLVRNVLTGELKDMFATAYGHGTMYLFLMAGAARMVGSVDPLVLRFSSALAGSLTVPALYLFARYAFGSRAALVAATLLATSHSHLHFSRIAVAGSIVDALFASIFWYLFLSGLQRRSLNRMVASGTLLGFWLHLYMGARLTALLVPVYLVALWILRRDWLRGNAGRLLVFVGAFLIAVAPIGYWAISHPDDFNARMNQTGVFQSGWLEHESQLTGESRAVLFARLFRDAFLSITVYPAVSFYNSVYPLLDWVSGSLFLLGLVGSFWSLRDPRWLLLNGWLWSTVLVAGAMVVQPQFGAYRMLMALPTILLLAALGWDQVTRLIFSGWNPPGGRSKLRPFLLTVVLLAVVGTVNLKYYFRDYALSCRYEDPTTRLASYIGSYYGRLDGAYSAYMLTAPRLVYGTHPSVDFLDGNRPIHDLRDPLESPPSTADFTLPAVFFLAPERRDELRFLKQSLPRGRDEVLNDCGEPILYVYKVPSGAR